MSLVYKKNGTYVILANTLSGHTTLGGEKASGITFDWVQIKIDTTKTDVNQTDDDQFRAQIANINSGQGTLIGWGDGTVSTPRYGASVDPVHTYPSNGIYRVRYGRLEGFAKGINLVRPPTGNDVLDNRKIKDIERCGQFSKIPWGVRSFQQADFTTTFSANDFPDVSLSGNVDTIGVFTLERAFAESTIETLPSTFTMSGSSGFNVGGMFISCANFDGEVGNITGVIYGAGGFFSDSASYNNNASSAINNLNFDFSGFSATGSGNIATAFLKSTSFNQPIGGWDISTCTSLYRTFKQALAFNQDIGSWDVGSVISLQETFNDADAFNNGDTPNTPGGGVGVGIDNWRFQTATGINMFYCFAGNAAFNQYIGSWNLKVNNLSAAFFLSVFNNGDAADVSGGGVGVGMDNWDVSLVGNMNDCFSNSPFNQYIGSWNTASLTQCRSALNNCEFNHDISTKTINPGAPDEYIAWDMSGVTTMSSMFSNNSSFNQNIGNWDTSSVVNTGFRQIFSGASSFNNGGSATIDSWDTSGSTSFSQMFRTATSFNQDLNSWNTALVESFLEMFYGATSFSAGTLGGWERTTPGDVSTVANVTDFTRMFRGTDFNGDISGWVVSGATTFDQMFHSCNTFNQDVSGWDVSGVDDFAAMFYRADSFDRDLSGWNLSSATDMSLMFDQIGGLSDTNVSNILIGWEASANTATGVNATSLFGNRTMNQTTYAAAKTAYDNLATAVGSGGKGWNLTNAITWV